MSEMKRRNKETKRKNKDKILALRKENEEMKKKLVHEGPSVGPTNLTGRSFTTPTGPRTADEPKDKIQTQEAYDDSYMNRLIPTTGSRHSFTTL